MSESLESQPRVPFGTKLGTATVTWFHRNPKLSNQHCLYCGEYVGVGSAVESDKEHLISRRIAAPGLMANPKAFNFIFRSCKRCNKEKADIEDHISAVTLLTSPGREHPDIDAAARGKAASSFDRRHKRPIGDVRNDFKITMGPFTFGLVSAAQPDRDAVILLAFRHVQGIFSLVTSRDPRQTETTRILSGDQFGYFGAFPYRDWGNPKLLEIARRAHSYERVADFTTADGFFRATLRPGPDGGPWFWALEWNQNFRVIGWIGDPHQAPTLFQNLPLLTWHRVSPTDRIREETALPDDAEDLLFDPVDP